jgi:hypothetical protein
MGPRVPFLFIIYYSIGYPFVLYIFVYPIHAMIQRTTEAENYVLSNGIRRLDELSDLLTLEKWVRTEGRRKATFPCLHGINLPNKVASTPRNCLGQVLRSVRPGVL